MLDTAEVSVIADDESIGIADDISEDIADESVIEDDMVESIAEDDEESWARAPVAISAASAEAVKNVRIINNSSFAEIALTMRV